MHLFEGQGMCADAHCNVGNVFPGNWKENRFFCASAMAFFALYLRPNAGQVISFLIACFLAVVIAVRIPPVRVNFSGNGFARKMISLLTAIGICRRGVAYFRESWVEASANLGYGNALFSKGYLASGLGVVLAVLALLAVYCYAEAFYRKTISVMTQAGLFHKISAVEIITLAALTFGWIAFSVAAFRSSDIYYGTPWYYDVLYTSDTLYFVKNKVYLLLVNPENDLRHPLFAVFSAPFAGIPYLFERLFRPAPWLNAVFLNSFQISLLLLAHYILAKMMRLSPGKTICFLLFTCASYMQLLSVLMIERYIIFYFWLILSLYLIAENKKQSRLALWGAGGTIVTSLVITPLMSEKSPVRDFKGWLGDMLRYMLEFVCLLLIFDRFDVIANLPSDLSMWLDFTGQSVSFYNKLCQYTAFIASCFFAPRAGFICAPNECGEFMSWQLEPAMSIHWVGVGILALCMLSAWLNRDRKSSLLAIGWIGFSFIVLVLIGWGTAENGLILYSLYFGWAFFCLLFQLAQKLGELLQSPLPVPVFTGAAIGGMVIVNAPAIAEFLRLAAKFYPA